MRFLLKNKAYLYIFSPLVIFVLINISGVKVSLSKSVSGIFWYATDAKNIAKGDYVFICIGDSSVLRKISSHLPKGDCGGSIGLLKQVVASTNDTITHSESGILVNGVLQPNSKTLDNKKLLKPLPKYAGNYTLKNNEFLVLGETVTSLDSRYFGPIKKEWITAKALRLY